jgi:putative membrane protein
MMWDGNGPWGHGAAWGAGGWLMGIGMIVILVAVVLLVVYLVRSTTIQQTQTHPPAYYAAPPAQQTAEQRAVESARDIVQRRYASGEIDREEYLQKLKDL